jgi:probable HAF family extracellular repeat protein
LNGDTAFATTKVKTNATRYVSSKELVATITIASDASLDQYDVMALTSSGKKGIGIELFTVTPQITDMGGLPNAWPSYAYQVSVAGVAVGYGYTGPNSSGTRHALRWTPRDGGMAIEDLTPRLGNTVESSAYGLNETGSVVGFFRTSAGKPHAFLLTASGMMDLHQLCGGATDAKDASGANDVNAKGEVVGFRGTVSDGMGTTYRAFYSLDGCTVELPALGGSTEATAINDNGVIVGGSAGSAVRWTRNPTTPGGWDIVRLGPGRATAINSAGDVVGYGGKFWPAGGGEFSLGNLGGTQTIAYGIDDDGTVAGWSTNASGVQRGFLWTAAKGMVELGSYSKSNPAAALAIAAGRIVGWAAAGTGLVTTIETHATLWTGY